MSNVVGVDHVYVYGPVGDEHPPHSTEFEIIHGSIDGDDEDETVVRKQGKRGNSGSGGN